MALTIQHLQANLDAANQALGNPTIGCDMSLAGTSGRKTPGPGEEDPKQLLANPKNTGLSGVRSRLALLGNPAPKKTPRHVRVSEIWVPVRRDPPKIIAQT
jgi:hypothetical protein